MVCCDEAGLKPALSLTLYSIHFFHVYQRYLTFPDANVGNSMTNRFKHSSIHSL